MEVQWSIGERGRGVIYRLHQQAGELNGRPGVYMQSCNVQTILGLWHRVVPCVDPLLLIISAIGQPPT